MSAVSAWINPAIDIERHRRELAECGRTQIADFLLPDIAERIWQCLERDVRWDFAYFDGSKGTIVPADTWRQMPPAQRQHLYQQVCASARDQFQYWYQTYMMVTAFLSSRDPDLFLHTLLQWQNAEEFLSLGRMLSGYADIRKADAQATNYTPGCFLTVHDDSGVPTGQIRRMAYVMSFSKIWRPEWGGLLQFTHADGDVVETFLPRFNTLNLFLTPQPHMVSCVAPFAPVPRLSITGWFRAD